MKRKKYVLSYSLIVGLLLVVNTYADTTLQDKIVIIAQKEIGKGEIIANNKGKDITRYFQGKREGAWCCVFVSWVLSESDISELGYNVSSRKLFNKARELGWVVEHPQKGDLIVFWRENKNSWKGHIGIIERVSCGEIISIEGNVGKFPSKVKRVKYPRYATPRLLGFIRISE